MSAVSTYILSIISAAMILSILKGILDEKSGASALIRVIGGLFLTFVVISPVSKLNINDNLRFFNDLSLDGEAAAADGIHIADKELRSVIKSNTEAYILDKAKTYGAEIGVEISLSNNNLPVSARIQGDISPYGKNQLQQILERELNIPKENQLWIG